MAANQYTIPLIDVMPVADVVDRCLVNGLLDLTVGFRLVCPEVYTLSENDYDKTHDDLVKVFSRLPNRTIVHYQGFFYEDQFKERYKGSSEIQRKNFEYFFERPVLRNYSNLYFTFQNQPFDPKLSDSPMVNPWGWLTGSKVKGIDQVVASLQKTVNPLSGDLSMVHKFKATRMDNTQLMSSVYDYMGLGYNKPGTTTHLQDFEIAFRDGYFKIGNQYIGVATVTVEGGIVSSSVKNNVLPSDITKVQLPRGVSLHTSMPFMLGMGLPFDHIYNLGIELLDMPTVENYFQGLNRVALNVLASLKLRTAEDKISQIDQYLNTLSSEDVRPARVKVNVIVHDPVLARLNEKMDYVSTAFSKMNDTKVFFENEHSANIFLTSSPGAMKFLYRQPHISALGQAVCYVPKENHYNSDPEGIVMVDRFGCPVIVNIWNSPHIVNRNGVIFGPSRTGKSVALNHFTTQFLHFISAKAHDAGHHVIIIDVGGSYKKNTAINGGFYFDANDKRLLTFNIFLCDQDADGNYLYDKADEDGEGGDDVIIYVYTVLKQLWLQDEKINVDAKNILKEIIRRFYDHVNKHRLFPDIVEFDKFLEAYALTMTEEYKRMISITSFRLALKSYVDGEDRLLLNARENLKLNDKSFIVFDLQGILNNADKARIVMTIIIGISADKVEKTKGVRKSIIIDEAIDFLKGDSGEFIGGYYRKIAKRGGQVLIATQGVDYLEDIDPLTKKSIFGNSDIKILLSHKNSTQSYPSLRRNLGLTDFDFELLDSMQNGNSERGERYRELFIKLGDFSKVYRTEIGLFAEGVYTSTASELEEIYKLEKEYGNLGSAINQFVENKYGVKK